MFTRTLLILSIAAAAFAQDSLRVEKLGEIEISSRILIINDQYLYSYDSDSLTIFDLSNPVNPREISNFNLGPGYYDLVLHDQALFCAGGDSMITILDLTDLEHPTSADSITLHEGSFIAIEDDLLFVATSDWESTSIRAYNIEDPFDPQFIAEQQFREVSSLITVRNSVVYMNSVYGITVIDVSDLENMQHVNQTEDYGLVFNLVFADECLYVASSDREIGVVVLDLEDPHYPMELGRYATPVGVRHLAVRDTLCYAICGYWGVRILDTSDPEDIEEVGYYDTEGSPALVALADDNIFYLAEYNFLGIYRFTDPNAVNDPATTTPTEYKLFPAYPNPFNSTTTLSFQLPHPDVVSLKLYDQSGREVRLLSDRTHTPGLHTFVWDAKGQPSGVYIARLSAGGYSQSAKLVLMR